jgi:hypothetical protein
VCQSAPSPTGSAAFEVTQRCCESRARKVVGEAPTTAAEGGCAPPFNRIVPEQFKEWCSLKKAQNSQTRDVFLRLLSLFAAMEFPEAL